MIHKLALRICPLPGCPKIGIKQGDRCPDHDKLMVREVYVHQQGRSSAMQESIDRISDPKLKEAFEKAMRGFGI